MLGKKKFVSVVAMASCMGAVFAAGSAVAAVPGRAGSLRVQPGVTGSRSVSSSSVATPTVSSEPSRMATLAGMNNLGAKPKLPSGASAAAVADLQDKLSELSADVDALRNAGVDEGAVRDILDSELANKNYATVPYVDDADSAKLAKDEFESKFDTRADEKKLVDEAKLAAETYTKGQVDDKVAGIKPTAAIRYQESTGDLQYQDSNDTWTTFANKADFAGADGKNIELQKTTSAIQWRVKGSGEAWTDLVSLDEITGAAGTVDQAQLESTVNAAISGANLASKADLDEYAKKSEVLSNDGTFSISDGKIVYTDPENGVVKDIVSVNDITGPAGNNGNDGADACEPQYTGTENANGDTDVVITCKEDSSKVLGRYTVKRGVNPCPGGISLEPVSTDASGATYNLVCEDGAAK